MSFFGNADMATFSGAVGAGSIYGGTGADTLDFDGAVGAVADLGAGADSLNFSGAVSGATITGTDTAGDVAILTGLNTVAFGCWSRCSGELRCNLRHVHRHLSGWRRLDLRRPLSGHPCLQRRRRSCNH